MRSTSWILAALAVSLLTWAQANAQGKKIAPARTVQDDANLFSSEAKEQANGVIAKIKSQYHKDFFVETVPSVTLPNSVDPKDLAAVNRFMEKWAKDRFTNHHLDGVYVGISVDPMKFEIEVGPTTLKEGWFTPENRAHLKDLLSKHLNPKDRNKLLVVASNYVLDTMAKHGRPAAANANPTPVAPNQNTRHQPQDQHQQGQQAEGFPQWLIWVGVGLGALLIFWLIMGLARAASGGGGGGYGGAPGMAGGGGGGGFMSSMLGGLFGAAAGMYLYNNFFGGHGSSAHAGEPYSAAGGNPQESTDVGAGDPSGEGGDWSDNNAGGGDDQGAGGGDWGGDAGGGGGGGGDWGGGGGGDWGGGGGGDWGGGGGGGDW